MHSGRTRKPRQKGMMFLEKFNRSIWEACQKKFIEEKKMLAEDEGAQPDPLNIRAMDFDGVSYTLKIPNFAENAQLLELTMTWECIPQLLKSGGQAMLDSQYSAFSPKVEGKTVTISADGNSLPGEADEICLTMALLRHRLFCSPVEYALDMLIKGEKAPSAFVDYRLDGRLYIAPGDDRIVVSHSIHFADETDNELVYVFLQEFADAQKRSRSAAPVCQFHKTPPAEVAKIASENNLEMPPNGVTTYYLTFSIQAKHVKEPKNRAKCMELIIGLRSYLDYHIKCTKAFLHIFLKYFFKIHTRMRNKVTELHKVLKAAYPQNVKGQGKKKKRKTKSSNSAIRKI